MSDERFWDGAKAEWVEKHMTHWLMMNGRGWGKGPDADTARRNLIKATGSRKVTSTFRIHPETVIHGDGMWEYPQGSTPTEFEPVRMFPETPKRK